MDEQFEMKLSNTNNTTKKRSRITGVMGSCALSAGAKSELEMRRIAASIMSSVEATSVTTMAVQQSTCGLISNNIVFAAENTSVFHKSSSALPGGAGAAAGWSGRGTGGVKVKKKRVRPSRRVPTVVVKTDTSNFRAMVQHFTGLPATTTSIQDSTVPPSASSSSS